MEQRGAVETDRQTDQTDHTDHTVSITLRKRNSQTFAISTSHISQLTLPHPISSPSPIIPLLPVSLQPDPNLQAFLHPKKASHLSQLHFHPSLSSNQVFPSTSL